MQELITLMVEATDNFNKFEKGNKSAGRRFRKNMQELKKAAQTARLSTFEVA
jgi:hypothetical protein